MTEQRSEVRVAQNTPPSLFLQLMFGDYCDDSFIICSMLSLQEKKENNELMF